MHTGQLIPSTIHITRQNKKTECLKVVPRDVQVEMPKKMMESGHRKIKPKLQCHNKICEGQTPVFSVE